MGLDTTSLKLRLVRIENDGTPAVLITSSIDTQQYYINIFSDLYHDKWPIEKDYKTIKCRMELENVSGKSTLCVYHNFHAKVFAKNLVWIMDFYVQDRLDQHASLKKYWHLINFTQAFSVIALFHDTSRRIMRLIADLQYLSQRPYSDFI